MCGLVVALAVAATSAPSASAATKYKNCAALNKVYKHGVAKPGARDKTSGKPVTTFKVTRAVYNSNTHLDRDKDGIACEKK
jgi:uncharacterized membrane protein